MSDQDAKYVNGDIRERKKRVEWVRRELKAYWWELVQHTSKWTKDPTESAEEQAKAEQRATYYKLVMESAGACAGPGMGLGEAERRVKEVVMPKLKEARGLGVDRVWFLYGGKMTEIDDCVQKWFGAQAADKEARARVSCALYELCEYRARGAPGVAGLEALKKACFGVFEAVWMVSLCAAKWQFETLIPRVWKLQAAREAFEAAGVAVTGSSAAAEVEKLLDQAAEDLDGLVTALEHARTEEEAASAARLVAEARLAGLMQRLQACG
jgi:hypothetical protein